MRLKVMTAICIAVALVAATGCSKGEGEKSAGEGAQEKASAEKSVVPEAKKKSAEATPVTPPAGETAAGEKPEDDEAAGEKPGADKGKDSGEETMVEQGQKMREEGLVSPNAPKTGEDVVAWSGEMRISKETFETYVNRLPPSQRREFSSLEKKQELLRNLIRFEMLAHKATDAGMADNPEVLLALKTEMVKRYLHQRFGEGSQVEVGEEEILAEFQKQYKRYNKPERVRASQIFITEKSKAEKVLKELKDALGKQRSNTRRVFREFVKKYSEDEGTRKRGGDLLFFSREGVRSGESPLDKAVVEAAFGIQNTDQVSTVIKGDSGFHILLITNRRKKVERTYEEVKEELRANLVRARLDEKRKEFMDSLVDLNDWHFEIPALKQITVEGAPDSTDVKARLDSIKGGGRKGSKGK